jgi:Mobilization protein NikA
LDAASREHEELTGTSNDSSGTGVSGQGRRRARQPVPRTRRVEFMLTGEEYAAVIAAAGRAGLARRAYVAQAAMAAAANDRAASDQESFGRILIELMRAAGLVRRIAANLNQAVAKLNATGQPAGDLPRYAAESIRRADHIDQVADAVRKALTRQSR